MKNNEPARKWIMDGLDRSESGITEILVPIPTSLVREIEDNFPSCNIRSAIPKLCAAGLSAIQFSNRIVKKRQEWKP